LRHSPRRHYHPPPPPIHDSSTSVSQPWRNVAFQIPSETSQLKSTPLTELILYYTGRNRHVRGRHRVSERRRTPSTSSILQGIHQQQFQEQ
ncbi:hypothetical protein LINPERPRIM_LOCUS42504, partial [Linum perenne]